MDLSHTAKLLYMLLLDRTTLSQKNGWQDSGGNVYVVYPIMEIADALDKGTTTVKAALNELEAAGLLERKRQGFSAPSRLYLKVPEFPLGQVSDPMTAGKPSLIQSEKRPYDSRKTDPMTVGKPSPNQLTINNLTENQINRVSGEQPAAYGRYENIFLTESEYAKLKEEYPDRLERFLDELSCYLAANGKKYQNYAAALHRWADNDKKAAPKQGIPDYSYKEGESL